MRIKLLSLAFAAAAIAVPAAKAHHAPGEDVRASASRPAVASPGQATIVEVVKPGGFDWDDAAVGAGVSVFVLGGAAGLALLATRRRLRPV